MARESCLTRRPLDILWHFALGYMPDFASVDQGTSGWVRRTHRGVNVLDRIDIPPRQKRYVTSPKFEFRINQAFEPCVRACADTSRASIQKRLGKTWLTEEFIAGLLRLRSMGFAHSWEAWHDNKLAGGVIGVQVGGLISMLSMFYFESHASKAALGRALLMFRDRGFEIVDRGAKPDHSVDYGIEWWPRWKYESAALRLCLQNRSISDEFPAPKLPLALRAAIPFIRLTRQLKSRPRTGMEVPPHRPAVEADVDPIAGAGPSEEHGHPPASANDIRPDLPSKPLGQIVFQRDAIGGVDHRPSPSNAAPPGL